MLNNKYSYLKIFKIIKIIRNIQHKNVAWYSNIEANFEQKVSKFNAQKNINLLKNFINSEHSSILPYEMLMNTKIENEPFSTHFLPLNYMEKKIILNNIEYFYSMALEIEVDYSIVYISLNLISINESTWINHYTPIEISIDLRSNFETKLVSFRALKSDLELLDILDRIILEWLNYANKTIEQYKSKTKELYFK
jgi:hypothetical protein